MKPEEVVIALEEYQQELENILSRFTRGRSGIRIEFEDNYRVRAITTEVIDLLHDHVPGSAHHRHLIATYYNEGISNPTESSSYTSVKEILDSISAVLKKIERNPALLREASKPLAESTSQDDPLDRIETVLRRFRAVAVQLRTRHSDRTTLDVGDEYDVQDLLHSLLRIDFIDVRKEEWNPSHAGGASRSDFLLPAIDTIIETKMTRKGLTARQLGDELIIDIEKYQSHPQCRRLICFVYDPEGRIANPAGIEADLMNRQREIDVRVFILPKHAE